MLMSWVCQCVNVTDRHLNERGRGVTFGYIMHQWVELVETAIKKKKCTCTIESRASCHRGRATRCSQHNALELGAVAAWVGGGLGEWRGRGPLSLLTAAPHCVPGRTQ